MKILLVVCFALAASIASVRAEETLFIGAITSIINTAAAQLAVNEINSHTANSAVFPGKNFTLVLINNGTTRDYMVQYRWASSFMQGTWDTPYNSFASSLSGPMERRTVAIVAPESSGRTIPVATVAAISMQPIISCASTNDGLSDKTKYPSFSRTVPPDMYQARAVLDFFRYYGWKRYAVISTTDAYSAGLASNIAKYGAQDGYLLVISRTISTADYLSPPSGTDAAGIRQTLLDIKASGARIIFAPISVEDLQAVVIIAYSLGMAGAGSKYVWVTSDGSCDPINLSTPTATGWTANTPQQMRAAFAGFTCVRPIGANSSFPAFWRSKQSALESFARVSAGTYNLTASAIYAGLNYDAVWSLAYALHSVISSGVSAHNGTAVVKAMGSVDFQGWTGRVRFTADGDRFPRFEMLNMQPTSGALSGVLVGEWNLASMATGRGDFSFSTPIVWADGVTTAPKDEYRPLVEVASSTKGATAAIAAILMLASAATSLIVYLLRNEEYMRANSPQLSHCMIAGTVCGYAATVANAFGEQAFVKCHLTHMLLLVCFSMTFGTLCARTWRIHRLFNQKVIQKIVIKDYHLMWMVFGAILWDVILVLGYFAGSPASITLTATMSDPLSDVSVCSYSNLAPFAVLASVPKLFLAAAALSLAWKVRNVGYNFNESKSIAFAVAIEFVVLCLSLPLWIAFSSAADISVWVLTGGVCASMLAVLAIVFWPRFIHLYAKKKRQAKGQDAGSFEVNMTYMEDDAQNKEPSKTSALGNEKENSKNGPASTVTASGAETSTLGPAGPQSALSNSGRRLVAPFTAKCHNCGAVTVGAAISTLNLDAVGDMMNKAKGRMLSAVSGNGGTASGQNRSALGSPMALQQSVLVSSKMGSNVGSGAAPSGRSSPRARASSGASPLAATPIAEAEVAVSVENRQ